MRKLKSISVFLLLILLAVLVGCSSLGGIKRDFARAGYTYDEEINEQIQGLLTEFEENDVTVTPHYFKKGYNFAFILEFKSSKEMNSQISESETLKGLLKDFKKSDFVRGNCVLIPIGVNAQEMIDVFQGK